MATAKTTKKTATTPIVEEAVTENVEEKSTNTVTLSTEQFEALMNRLNDLEGKVKTQGVTQSVPSGNDRFYNYLEVEVPVVSMCQGELNLATQGRGQGNIYTFTDFGQIMDIPFGDLKDIVQHNQRFANEGYFYIADEEVVKKLRKTSEYNKMLPPDVIENIFKNDANKIIDIYNMAPRGQKETIVEMIKNKCLQGINVDANVLVKLGELTGIDFVNIEAE